MFSENGEELYNTPERIGIAICDDELIYINKLKSALVCYQKEEKIMIDIKAFDNPTKLLKQIAADPELIQIVLLDIQIENENGIEIARRIHDINKEIIVIFVSGYDSYMQAGYEVNAFRYILKDQLDTYFFKNISAAISELQKRNTQVFTYKVKGEVKRVKFSDIIYFESFQRLIHIVTVHEKDSFYGKLDEIEKQLNYKRFVRSHKSYLVNVDFIESLSANSVKLKDSISVPISRGKLEEVRKALVWSMR